MIRQIKINPIGRLVAFCFLLLLFTDLTAQQSIAAARLQNLGTVITTTGTVTCSDEFGQIRFMQDATAGISVYSSSLANVIAGDSLKVTGTLSLYRGQLEITPVQSFQVIQHARPLPAPRVISLNNIQNPSFESMRVELDCIGIASCESYIDNSWYTAFDTKGNSFKLISAQVGYPVPDHSLNSIGIWVNVDGTFQQWSQSIEYADENSCKIIPRGVVSFDTEEAHVFWNYSSDGNTWAEYGIDTFDHLAPVFSFGTDHIINLFGLIPGQIYQVRLANVSQALDTSYSIPTFLSAQSITSSPIAIFFDKDVNASYSDGSHPAGTGPSVIENDIISRIDQISSTMDIAMYNDTKVTIVDAIKRAVQRGVAVRYVAESSNSNSALDGTINFPVLYREGSGIMHNKFIIADADIPEKAWLWTGSTNFTGAQLSTDANHAYVIKDQALAVNYRREFDELWGSSSDHTGAKEGEQKFDNTAHLFKINGSIVESYFSPSDETSCHIMNALSTADHQALIGLLLLTKDDLTDEIIALHDKGVEVRVIIEDAGTSSSSITRLRQAGVDVAIHNLSGLFHHKYAIIDEGYADSDPMVISGSHNWTLSADNINDENTLIFHDQSIANIF
ncbi:MAG: phospholipase D-like domain-containing protein, partial [Saprospiraceae bacterium]